MPDAPKLKTGMFNKKIAGVSTKWWLLGGGAAGVLYYHHMSKASAAATATDPNALDPTAQAQQGQYGSSSSDPYAGYDGYYGSGAGGAYSPVDPTTQAAQDQTASDTATALEDLSQTLAGLSVAPASNGDWQSSAVAALEQGGYSSAAAQAAVEAYMLGLPLTHKQVQSIEAAVGLVGYPPNGAPPIHQIATPKPDKKARSPKSVTQHMPTTHGKQTTSTAKQQGKQTKKATPVSRVTTAIKQAVRPKSQPVAKQSAKSTPKKEPVTRPVVHPTAKKGK